MSDDKDISPRRASVHSHACVCGHLVRARFADDVVSWCLYCRWALVSLSLLLCGVVNAQVPPLVAVQECSSFRRVLLSRVHAFRLFRVRSSLTRYAIFRGLQDHHLQDFDAPSNAPYQQHWQPYYQYYSDYWSRHAIPMYPPEYFSQQGAGDQQQQQAPSDSFLRGPSFLEGQVDVQGQLASNTHNQAKAAATVIQAGGGGNFPEQEWTYKDIKNPPVRLCSPSLLCLSVTLSASCMITCSLVQAWLRPSAMSRPGLPITKPPPVPQMVPPPPPFPAYLDNTSPYSGAGSEAPSPPTYALQRPPPGALLTGSTFICLSLRQRVATGSEMRSHCRYRSAGAMPRWIPWTSFYVPDQDTGAQQANQAAAPPAAF